MTAKDWKQVVNHVPDDTPVIFYWGENRELPADSYCEGKTVRRSVMWEEGRKTPCILATLMPEP